MLDEINPIAAIIAVIFGGGFIIAIWKIQVWANVSIKSKIAISVVMIPILYFVALKMINK